MTKQIFALAFLAVFTLAADSAADSDACKAFEALWASDGNICEGSGYDQCTLSGTQEVTDQSAPYTAACMDMTADPCQVCKDAGASNPDFEKSSCDVQCIGFRESTRNEKEWMTMEAIPWSRTTMNVQSWTGPEITGAKVLKTGGYTSWRLDESDDEDDELITYVTQTATFDDGAKLTEDDIVLMLLCILYEDTYLTEIQCIESLWRVTDSWNNVKVKARRKTTNTEWPTVLAEKKFGKPFGGDWIKFADNEIKSNSDSRSITSSEYEARVEGGDTGHFDGIMKSTLKQKWKTSSGDGALLFADIKSGKKQNVAKQWSMYKTQSNGYTLEEKLVKVTWGKEDEADLLGESRDGEAEDASTFMAVSFSATAAATVVMLAF